MLTTIDRTPRHILSHEVVPPAPIAKSAMLIIRANSPLASWISIFAFNLSAASRSKVLFWAPTTTSTATLLSSLHEISSITC